MANMEVEDYFAMLIAMLAKQQGIAVDNVDAVMTETNAQSLREALKRGRDDWAKMALANLSTDTWAAVEDAKEKAVTAAEKVAKEVL